MHVRLRICNIKRTNLSKVKLLRAYGECLGNRTEEGRGYLRKALVSWKQAMTQGCPNVGTQQSEPLLPVAEHIGCVEGTQGTETSKYLEENKENSILLVVANETGIAQTNTLGYWGCRTCDIGLERLVEQVGKPDQRG